MICSFLLYRHRGSLYLEYGARKKISTINALGASVCLISSLRHVPGVTHVPAPVLMLWDDTVMDVSI